MQELPKTHTTLVQSERDELAKNWSKLIGSIHHDCKSALSIMHLHATHVAAHLPPLLEAYQLASDKGILPTNALEPRQRERMAQFPQSILQSVERLSQLLKWMHPLHHDLLSDSTQAEHISAKFFIESFVQQPCFSESEKKSIHINHQDDFTFNSIPFFTKNLLFFLSDLMKFAWKPETEKIEIDTRIEKECNTISFKILFSENGCTYIPTARMTHFFFRNSTGEMSIEFPFYELALLQLGGKIEYDFVPKKHLSFLITLPKQGNT